LLTFLMPHALIMISRRNPCSPLSHSCKICGRFLPVVLTATSATAFRNNRPPRRLSWYCFGPESPANCQNTQSSYIPRQCEWPWNVKSSNRLRRQLPRRSPSPIPREGIRRHYGERDH
jgi:hypothetical protein